MTMDLLLETPTESTFVNSGGCPRIWFGMNSHLERNFKSAEEAGLVIPEDVIVLEGTEDILEIARIEESKEKVVTKIKKTGSTHFYNNGILTATILKDGSAMIFIKVK